MKDKGASDLSQDTGGEGRDGPAGAAEGADDAHAADLLAAGEVAREDDGGAGVHGSQQQTDDGEGHGLADDVGHEPDEQLEDGGADDEDVDEPLLADLGADGREREPAQRDACPEARRHVADRRGVPVARRDQERDDPARDGDLGTLVGEDEDGAQDHDPRLEGDEHGAHVVDAARYGLGQGVVGLIPLAGAAAELLLVAPEGPGREAEVPQDEAERQQVVAAPEGAGRHDGGGDDGADGAADAVAAVHGAQHGGAVLEVGAEDVADGELDGEPEADEEVGDGDDGEGRRADQRQEPDHHADLRQREGLGPPEPVPDLVDERRRHDEAERVADEDEGHDGVSDIVMANECTSISLRCAKGY